MMDVAHEMYEGGSGWNRIKIDVGSASANDAYILTGNWSKGTNSTNAVYDVNLVDIRFSYMGKHYGTTRAIARSNSEEETKKIIADAFQELVTEVFKHI